MLLRILFPVKLVERRLTTILFLHGFFAVGAFVAGRSVRDALFLAHLGREPLAWMYVASAASVALCGLAYTSLAGRVRHDRATSISALLFGALFAIAWLAERSHRSWVYAALYVHVEVMGALSVMQFWTLANELFNPREARRLYGLIGAGGTIANVIVGLATVKIASAFTASAVLLLCAGLLVGCAAAAFFAGRAGQQRIVARVSAAKTPAGLLSGASRVLTSGHLRLVALLAIVTFFTTTIVDFEFKVAASATLGTNELAIYFGYFYVVVGAFAVALQLFGTGGLLNRVGVIGSLAILPLSLGLGSILIAVSSTLWAAAITKGADTLFRYSINDATTQILYLPIVPHSRASSKAFIDGVTKPFAIGLAGLVLLVYRHWLPDDPFHLALPSVLLCIIWGAVVLGLRSKYVQSLQDNLRKRRLDVEFAEYKVQDGSTSNVLTRALESGDEREISNALELLAQLQNIHLDDRVEALLDHALPGIRIGALKYYARRQTVRYANSIFRKFDDPDPAVRAAAIDAFCAIGRDKSVRSVKSFLTDPDPHIRSAAMIGMIRYGGLDGILSAADALKQLIAHPDPAMRIQAADVLGAIGVTNFYQPVVELMNDPDSSVRRHAIEAAGALRSPEFVTPLVYKTLSSETGREAVEALSAYGPAIAHKVASVFANRLEDPRVRIGIAKLLGRLATREAVEIMLHHLDEPDEDLRAVIYRSLARTTKRQQLTPGDRSLVYEAVDRELLCAYRCLVDSEVLALGSGPGPSTPKAGRGAAEALLASALAEKAALAERRIFQLLAVLFPEGEMERIHAEIRGTVLVDSMRRRATAVELLDNLLDRKLKRKLLPLIEDTVRGEKIAAAADFLPLARGTRDETVAVLCRSETAWVRACALNYAAQLNCAPASDAVLAAVADPSPVVREIALISSLRTTPERAQEIARSKLADEAFVVRRQAALIAGRRATA